MPGIQFEEMRLYSRFVESLTNSDANILFGSYLQYYKNKTNFLAKEDITLKKIQDMREELKNATFKIMRDAKTKGGRDLDPERLADYENVYHLKQQLETMLNQVEAKLNLQPRALDMKHAAAPTQNNAATGTVVTSKPSANTPKETYHDIDGYIRQQIKKIPETIDATYMTKEFKNIITFYEFLDNCENFLGIINENLDPRLVSHMRVEIPRIIEGYASDVRCEYLPRSFLKELEKCKDIQFKSKVYAQLKKNFPNIQWSNAAPNAALNDAQYRALSSQLLNQIQHGLSITVTLDLLKPFWHEDKYKMMLINEYQNIFAHVIAKDVTQALQYEAQLIQSSELLWRLFGNVNRPFPPFQSYQSLIARFIACIESETNEWADKTSWTPEIMMQALEAHCVYNNYLMRKEDKDQIVDLLVRDQAYFGARAENLLKRLDALTQAPVANSAGTPAVSSFAGAIAAAKGPTVAAGAKAADDKKAAASANLTAAATAGSEFTPKP